MTVISAIQELGKEGYIHRAYLGNLVKSFSMQKIQKEG